MTIDVPGIVEAVAATLAATAIAGVGGLWLRVTAQDVRLEEIRERLTRIETKLDNMLDRCFAMHGGAQ